MYRFSKFFQDNMSLSVSFLKSSRSALLSVLFFILAFNAHALNRSDTQDTSSQAQNLSQRLSFLEVPADPENGGPLDWQIKKDVKKLPLYLKADNRTKIIKYYQADAILDNLGCKKIEKKIWCDVQELGGGPRGYVEAKYLTPAISPSGLAIMGPDTSALRAGKGKFDAKGKIPCAVVKGQPMTQCDFAVARTGGGYATVIVTKPDKRKRGIYFRMGRPIGADTSEADNPGKFKATKEADLHFIRIGHERYEIPDAVILGG